MSMSGDNANEEVRRRLSKGSNHNYKRRLSSEEMNEDFDDMETDERVNVPTTQNSSGGQLYKELLWFPDPLVCCIGFTVVDYQSDKMRREEIKVENIEIIAEGTGSQP